MKRVVVTCLWFVFAAQPAQGINAADYLRDVKPVLKERCYACHAALKQEGQLRLDTAAAIRAGGESGSAMTPGKPGESLLLARIGAADLSERMPPEGKPLSPEQIAAISAWIAAGAVAPADETPEPDPRQHWAFQPPHKETLPRVGTGVAMQNPIDSFLARLFPYSCTSAEPIV